MNIQIKNLELKLKKTFKISHSEFSEIRNFLLIVQKNGYRGFGECVPIDYFNEPAVRAYKELCDVRKCYFEKIETVYDLVSLQNFICILENQGYMKCTVCAYEMALLDLLANIKKQPLWQILNLENPGNVKSAVTLSLADISFPLDFNKVQGQIVKMKLGGDNDLSILNSISAYKGEKEFILDVNGGWSAKQYQDFSSLLNDRKILLIEEPLDSFGMTVLKERKITNGTNQIFLDESITSEVELDKYINYIDGINIKIVKVGGILRSFELIRKIREKKKKLLLGCFLQTQLSIAYSYHISSLFDYIDLDGAMLLADDPFSGFVFNDGFASLESSRPGIGVYYG